VIYFPQPTVWERVVVFVLVSFVGWLLWEAVFWVLARVNFSWGLK
jgi:hypothetical protein